MNIQGKLVKKLNVEQGTSKAGKEWKKQSFVIDTGDQYNPYLSLSLFGEDKVKILDKFKEGDYMDVHFNLSSREFKDRWYTQADAWKIDPVDSAQEQPNDLPASSDEDDLLF